jgi:RNA polymerase sigma-70 factor (ECF subfamily)
MTSKDERLPERPADCDDLASVFEKYRPRLEAMVRRRLDRTLARRIDPGDILADAFVQARRKWALFKQSSFSPYCWLYRIVMDCLIDNWRRHTRGRRDLRRDLPWPEQSSIQLACGLLSPQSSPSKVLARAELQDQVRRILGELKEADRQIIWMRNFDELSFKEAAQILGIMESAATLRYVRAIERLKKLWRRLQPGPESCP